MKKTLITIGTLGLTAFAAYKLVNKLNDELDRLEFGDEDEEFYALAKELGLEDYGSSDQCKCECAECAECECAAECEAAEHLESLSAYEKLLLADSLGIIDLNKINKFFHHPV